MAIPVRWRLCHSLIWCNAAGSETCAVLHRDVSNSPFFISGRRLGRTSVQEELERHLVPLLRADRAKFLCAGVPRPGRKPLAPNPEPWHHSHRMACCSWHVLSPLHAAYCTQTPAQSIHMAGC